MYTSNKILTIVIFLIFCIFIASCGERIFRNENRTVAVESEIIEPDEEIVRFDPRADFELGDAEIGREYFFGENRGRCLTCHTLYGEGEPSGWALDDTGLRRDKQWLAIYLDNPRNLRPEVVRMPPYRGDESATIPDIVAFLLTLTTPVEHPVPGDIKPESEPDKWIH
ncbi:MAG TPA: hypothetical protein ENN67_03870 [Firmicutes bacterium]|nr:hypothetical protein [Bacillota bacterium]